ncbi:MAG: YHS domain-containing protein [Thermoleophilaceae bacterium]|nr:YHS domain-containing protein [Thermoleophilaceae bacterium]
MEPASPSDRPEGSTHTFLFADLAGFTALTEVHGDEDAADLAGDFCAAIRRLLREHDAEEIKTIGDAVMVRCNDPAGAVRLGARIVRETGAQHGFPTVRVGMHTGPAIERDGDWFGASVNLAARVSGVAPGGTVLVTEATRAAAGQLDRIELREHGRQSLKNVAEPVLLFAAVAQGDRNARKLPIDPVCRMAVDPRDAAAMLRHDGVEFHLCSFGCVRAFVSNPERYVADP